MSVPLLLFSLHLEFLIRGLITLTFWGQKPIIINSFSVHLLDLQTFMSWSVGVQPLEKSRPPPLPLSVPYEEHCQ